MGRGGRRQSGVSCFRPVLLTLQQRFKRATPSVRKRIDPQCALQTIAWMRRQIEERVNLSDGHALCRLSHLHDFVSRADLTFAENAEIEARPAAGCEQCRHPRFVHANADAIACDAGLSDLEKRGADLKSIADAHGVISQSFDRKVLAKLSVNEIVPLQLLLPVAIRFNLINEDGSMFTSVPGQVALTVSLQVQTADAAATTSPHSSRRRCVPCGLSTRRRAEAQRSPIAAEPCLEDSSRMNLTIAEGTHRSPE